MNSEPRVISVGNISLGGAGKTPHTIEITNEYIKRGEKAVILSLGYKGKLGYGMNTISDGNNIFYKPPEAADEPYMMALNCPNAAVITGKNRKTSLDYASDHFGSTLAILDDGFQHKALQRHADILLLDYRNPVSTGLPFPFGYLREMPSSIRRADIIIFTRAEDTAIPERAKKYIEGKPVFFSKPVLNKFIMGSSQISLNDLKGVKVGGFSAVASNNSFYNSLSSAGLSVVGFKGFKDHGIPAESTLRNLVKSTKLAGGEYFITTEKDHVKLSDEMKSIFGYLKMEIEIYDRTKFFDKIDELLKRRG